jgi:hypothetical protein
VIDDRFDRLIKSDYLQNTSQKMSNTHVPRKVSSSCPTSDTHRITGKQHVIICLRFPALVIGFPDIKRKYILSTFPQLHVFMFLVLYCSRPLQFPCINDIWFVFLPICFAIGSYFIYITCILWYLQTLLMNTGVQQEFVSDAVRVVYLIDHVSITYRSNKSNQNNRSLIDQTPQRV